MSAVFGITPNGGYWGASPPGRAVAYPGEPKCYDFPPQGGAGPNFGTYGSLKADFIADLFYFVRGFTDVSISGNIPLYEIIGYSQTIPCPIFPLPRVQAYVVQLNYSASNMETSFNGNRLPCAQTDFTGENRCNYLNFFQDFGDYITDEAIFLTAPLGVTVTRTEYPDPRYPGDCPFTWPTYTTESEQQLQVAFSTGFIGYDSNTEGYNIRVSVKFGGLPIHSVCPPIPPYEYVPPRYGSLANTLSNPIAGVDAGIGYCSITTRKGTLQIPIEEWNADTDTYFGTPSANISMTAYY